MSLLESREQRYIKAILIILIIKSPRAIHLWNASYQSEYGWAKNLKGCWTFYMLQKLHQNLLFQRSYSKTIKKMKGRWSSWDWHKVHPHSCFMRESLWTCWAWWHGQNTYLGVTLQQDLSWDQYIRNICCNCMAEKTFSFLQWKLKIRAT